jgi:hypothetical protein
MLAIYAERITFTPPSSSGPGDLDYVARLCPKNRDARHTRAIVVGPVWLKSEAYHAGQGPGLAHSASLNPVYLI